MHLIYLDHAATTPLDPRVLGAMLPYMQSKYGNPGSLHAVGRNAKDAVDIARAQTARFFSCDPEQVVFTSGGTEGNNTVFAGLEKYLLGTQKNAVMISGVEHDSVWKSAHDVCEKHGLSLIVCPPDSDGEVKLSAVAERYRPDIGLVSVMLANNETGVVNDIAGITDFCHERGIICHTDAVQAAGLLDLDVRRVFPVDFMTISSHKINGPKGVGALYVRHPDIIRPLICGGADQEHGLRGGTENVAGIVGLGMACELAAREMEKNVNYLHKVHSQIRFMLARNAEKKGIQIAFNGGVGCSSPKILSVRLPGVDAETLILMLDMYGICVSAGSACRAHENTPSRVLTAMGIADEDARCTIRISLSHMNTSEEITQAASTIVECAEKLLYASGSLPK